jgi:hypothetical protein
MALHNIQLPSRVLSNWISPILKRSSAASIGLVLESFFNICLGLSILDGTSPLVEWGWPASHSKIISIKENKQLVSSERDSVIRE